MTIVRSLLLYNPVSGVAPGKREALIRRIALSLEEHGFDVTVQSTTHRGSAGLQVREAIAQGIRVVFACGGDGTIHDVLQGIVGTDALLAPIPLGSANALCRELRIPLHPLRAAAAYAKATQREVRVANFESASGTRSFLLMAGAGPDGALMYRMLAASRSRAGRWAYAFHALRLLLRGRFTGFRARYKTADGLWHEAAVVSAITLRIGNLGGVFPGIARGASLDSTTMRLLLVRPPALLALPLWFLSSWLRVERWNPLLIRQDVVAFQCDGEGIHAQADGEWIGKLPLSVSLEETTVRLLIPVA